MYIVKSHKYFVPVMMIVDLLHLHLINSKHSYCVNILVPEIFVVNFNYSVNFVLESTSTSTATTETTETGITTSTETGPSTQTDSS